MIKKAIMTFLISVVGLHLILMMFTSFYVLEETEQAVVEVRGKVTEVVKEPGFKFKLPYPYAKVKKINMQTFSLAFGYKEAKEGDIATSDAKMITGDENIVLADLVLQYRVTDIEKYLYSNEDPVAALYNAVSASIRAVIGSTEIDSALTDGKADIETKVREKLVTYLEKLDIGIGVTAVKLQDVDLPNAEVRKAFTDVTDAREMMNTKTNEAEKYNNEKINVAQGEKEAIISRAQGEKSARIEAAIGDVAVFNSLYNEYKNSKAITKERLILETMDEVLKDANIYIIDGKSTNSYLPINELKKNKGGEQ